MEKNWRLWVLAAGFLSIALSHPPKWTKVDRDFRNKYFDEFSERKGYLGNKIWDKFIVMASTYEDTEILEKMLNFRFPTTYANTVWVTDLFSVCKANPDFFIRVSYQFFDGNMDCVVNLFQSSQEIISPEEVIQVFSAKTSQNQALLSKKFFRRWNQVNLKRSKKTLKLKDCFK